MWTHLFCSVNLPLGYFYHNSLNNQFLKPLDPITNKPLYLDYNARLANQSTYSLIIQGAKLNTTRIFIRDFMLFKEFIPKEVSQSYLFYKDIKLYQSDISMILFYAEIPILKSMDASNIPYISYYNIVNVANNVSLVTLPIKTYSIESIVIDLKLCDKNSKTTQGSSQLTYNMNNFCQILSPSCPANDFCIDETTRFYCLGSNKLQLSNLVCFSSISTMTTNLI